MLMLMICAAGAEDKRHYTIHNTQGDFEEVFQDVQDAVINQGLVIDYVGHVNKMLERTADVSGGSDGESDKSPFLNAKYLQFCSSVLTHEAVRIKPQNLATCPNVIFVYQTVENPDRVVIGYRDPELGIPGPTRPVMAKLTALMEKIIGEAISE